MIKGTNKYTEALKEARKKNADLGKAWGLLHAAYKAGNPEAAYAIGTWYLHGKHVERNFREALKMIRFAANKNVPGALFDLAVCYEKGEGAKKSLRKAAEYYLRSALYGDHQAIHAVGRCYYHGIGFNKDRHLAWVWLDRARELDQQKKTKK